MNPDDIRQRQRLYVKRSYYRAQQRMKELRSEVHELETKSFQVLSNYQQRRIQAEFLLQRYGISLHTFDRYVFFTYEKEILLRERKKIMNKLTTYNKVHDAIANVLEKEMLITTPSPPILVNQLTTDECLEISRVAYQEILAFRASTKLLSTGAALFGWRDHRQYDHETGLYSFSIKKVFHNHTPTELAYCGWSAHTAAKFDRALYCPTMNIRTWTLQEVNNDSALLYRVITSPDGTQLYKTLLIVSRFQISNGYLIIFKSCEKDRYINDRDIVKNELDAGYEIIWQDHLFWILYEETGENGQDTNVDFGGFMPKDYEDKDRGTEIWMLFFLFMAQRLESFVIGPMVVLK